VGFGAGAQHCLDAKMNKLLLKYKNQVSVAIAVVFVIFAGYLVFGPKPQQPSFGKIYRPSGYLESRITTDQVNVNFVTKREVPKKALVYKMSKKRVSEATLAKLAAKFGFSGKAKSKKPYVWKTKKKEIVISKDLLKIDFKNSGVRGVKKGLSETALIEKAKKFLKSRGLLKEDLIASSEVVYLASSKINLGRVETFKKAGFVQISFDRKIGDLFVFEKSPQSSAATVILNKKGQVSKMFYTGFKIASQAEYPIKNRNEAAEAIKSDGFLVDINRELEEPIDPQQFDELVIEDYFLAYLQEDVTNVVQPIYVLRGRGLVGDYVTDVVIYVPALEGLWLK
jgi:hypothetical protein